MERSWEVSGVYATWTLTMTAAPPDTAEGPFSDEWSPGPLDRIGEHFADAVNLVECYRELDEAR
jgi:hypothetical protein